jgi:hypothetical protein
MSRDRGNRAAAWVATYLTRWWPHAEKTPNGRPGADVLGTPGVAWEVKTSATWRNEWLGQVAGYTAHTCQDDHEGPCRGFLLPVLVYLPPGMGEKSVAHAQAVMPLHVLMQVLTEAGYAPQPKEPA